MATTVLQSFEILRKNLEITGLQGETVSTRQQGVRAVVEAGLKVQDSFLAGSYSRNTMIAPLKEADIDIFVVLDSSYYWNYNAGLNGGQAGLLDLLRRTLLKTYTRTPDISRNGQAVTIRFDDFVVDVVPAFARAGGGYLIPNSISGSWIETDPKKHAEIIKNLNAQQSGLLVPLIKMIKGWNREHGAYFRSFHLEVLAFHILSYATITDYPSGVRYYFDKARALVAQKNLDPAGYGGDVGAYLNSTDRIQEAVRKFETAFQRAVRAEQAALRYPSNAIEDWRTIFGSYFPAYG